MVLVNLVTHPVHRVGDLVVGVARKVFIKRCCVYFAPGALLLQRQPLHTLEDVIGN